MATDNELYELADGDHADREGCLERVTSSLCRAAFALVDGGATGTAEEKFAKRKFAGAVLYNPAAEALKAFRILVYSNEDQDIATIISISNNRTQLDAQTAGIVDELIQIHAGKDASA